LWTTTAISALAAAMAGAPAYAQTAAPSVVEEVVVTGSLIAGTPEDAALPVDVITADTLQRQGNPSALEIIKQLPGVAGVLGDSNQFPASAGGAIGVGSLDLRGLGSQRTLVLINGRRAPNSGANAQVDTNLLPVAAIGRVEILRGGGSTIYGSDAMAGVVNFITRTDLNGLELAADYRYIPGADQPDGTLAALWGWSSDQANVLVTAGYQHRGQLASVERDWVVRRYWENPQAFSGLGNPGVYRAFSTPQTPGVSTSGTPVVPANLPNAPASGLVRDPACGAFNTFPGFVGGAVGAAPACYWSYVPYDNLVEETHQYQVYGEVNFKLTDTINWHAEALWSRTELPDYRVSPGYGPSYGIAGTSAPLFTIPVSNPGALNFLRTAGYSEAQIASIVQVNPNAGQWRPLAAGGNQTTGGRGGQQLKREAEMWRVSTSVNGDLFAGIGFDVALTVGHNEFYETGKDMLATRLDRALRGFGGPNCTSTNPADAGNAAANCYYYNPFGSAVQTDTALGGSNPAFVPALANRDDVVKHLFYQGFGLRETELFVADAAVDGALPFELPGGAPKWAVGYQYRLNGLSSTIDPYLDARVTPCTIPGDSSCLARTGPFIFLGVNTPIDVTQKTNSVFGELNLPFTEALNAQLALRYESYGEASTLNPRIAAKWQVIGPIALRATYETTFRNPPANLLGGSTLSLPQVTAAQNQSRSVETVGNPDLQPEKGTDYSVGVLLDWNGIRASVDYWHYRIEDQIAAVPFNSITAAVIPGNNSAAAANCASPFAQFIKFTVPCAQARGADIATVQTFYVNGPQLETAGIDYNIEYRLPDVFGGDLAFGVSAVQTLKYRQGAFTFNGATIQAPLDALGKANYDLSAQVPKWRANAFAEFRWSIHSLRLVADYDGKLRDDRPAVINAPLNTNPGGGYVLNPANNVTAGGGVVKANLVFDLHYRVELPWDTTFNASILNLADKDPPFARLPYGYDPFTGNPLGRSFEVGVRKRF
jgi:iron complex outermembrane receptor protein